MHLFFEIFCETWKSLKGRSRFLLLLSIVLFVIASISRVSAPMVFAWLVSSTQDLSEGIAFGVLLYAAIFLFTRVIEEIRFIFYVSFEQEIQKLIALRTIDRFFRIPFTATRLKFPSENAIAVDRGLSGIRDTMYYGIFSIAPILIEATVLIFVVGDRVGWLIAIWVFVILCLFLWVTVYYSKKTKELEEKWFETASNNYKILAESLRSYETIRSFDQSHWVRKRYSHAVNGFIKEVKASLRPGIVLGVFQGLILAVLIVSITYSVFSENKSAKETVATLVLVNGLLLQIITPLLEEFSGAYRLFIQGLASSRELFDILRFELVPVKYQHKEYKEEDAFRIQNLSVTYDDKLVLNIKQLLIPTNQLIVICGVSGSGKSTLASCLAGLKAYQGTIFSRISSEHIFYMVQDVHVFDTSIEENVSLGLPVETEKMKAILGKAGIGEDEYQSLTKREVGENGVYISGGQRQRIGLARMLYHDAKILILDEPTSALDSQVTEKILLTLKQIAKEKTCIVVTHDQRCIELADMVIEIKNGEIVHSYSH
jgi:ABC-type bacteriocin/lantibiotic exporter with double-glycine peptidase domain